jgi:hypothetical protein
MPVRAGADSVVVATETYAGMYILTTQCYRQGVPYGVKNGAKANDFLYAIIKFDDGTYGWVRGTAVYPIVLGNINNALDVGDTPDEYIGTFTVPVPIRVSGIGWAMEDDNAATEAYELILYSDPYGTPVAEQTVSIVAVEKTFESSSLHWIWFPITEETLVPGTTYGVAIRPTVGTISLWYIDLQSATFEAAKKVIPFVQNVKFAARTNQSGAFAEIQTYYCPYMSLSVNGLAPTLEAGGGLKIVGSGGLAGT